MILQLAANICRFALRAIKEAFRLYFLLYNYQKLYGNYLHTWLLLNRPNTIAPQSRGAVMDGMGDRARVITGVWTIFALSAAHCVSMLPLILAARLSNDQNWRFILFDITFFLDADPRFNIFFFVYGVTLGYNYIRVYTYDNQRGKDRVTIWLAMQFVAQGDARFCDQQMWIKPAVVRQRVAVFLKLQQYFNKFFGMLT